MSPLSPPTAEQLGKLVSRRFDGIPTGFMTLSGTTDGDPDALFAEERECVRRAIPSRQREFAAGRSLARQALSELGATQAPLLAAPDRRPLWPGGFVGSISHAGGACVVCVGRSGVVASVGLDLEVDEALSSELLPLVCRPAESARLEAHGMRGAKAAFSTKEAVYKCLHPLTGVFLEFHDVDVQLDLDAECFVARVLHPALAQSPYRHLVGRVVRGQGWIVCAVSVPPIDASPASAPQP